jgi:hypothetical protein
VSHTGLAVSFVAGSYQVSNINRDLGYGVIGKEENVKAVRESILRDSFNGSDLLNASR